jgi:prophage DNA circulation protein
MSHVRTQIRDAIVAALDPLGSVHKSRVYPLQPDELPAFLVYSDTEDLVGDFALMERAYRVNVEIVVRGDDYEAQLDEQLVAVEKALNGSLTDLVVSILPVAIATSVSGEGSAPIGRMPVTFEAAYRTSFDDPETAA